MTSDSVRATSDSVRAQLQRIFRDVLNQPDLLLKDDLTASDVPGWDSLSHISLMFSVESHFGITFTDSEMGSLADVGELLETVTAKVP